MGPSSNYANILTGAMSSTTRDLKFLNTLVTVSEAFLRNECAIDAPPEQRKAAFELLRNTLLFRANAAAIEASCLKAYQHLPRTGYESNYELKEIITQVCCACVAWQKLKAAQGVPAAEERAALTLSDENGQLIPMYRFAARAFDATDVAVSPLRALTAMGCFAAVCATPEAVTLDSDAGSVAAVLLLFSLQDIQRLGTPAGAPYTASIERLTAQTGPRMSLFRRLNAEVTGPFAPNKSEFSLPETAIAPLIEKLTNGCQDLAYLTVINSAIRVFRWWVDLAGGFLFAWQLKDLVIEDSEFKRFNADAMARKQFDADVVDSNLKDYAKRVRESVLRHVKLEHFALAASASEAGAPLPDMDAPLNARVAANRINVIGRLSEHFEVMCR